MLDLKKIEREIQDFVKASELPVMPLLWERVNKITSDRKSSAHDLSEVILQDQVLTSKVISVANTPFWGIGQKVTTITKAVLVLGFNTIRNLVLMVSVSDGMMKHFSGPVFNTIWIQSIGCGVAARSLAHRLGTDPEQAMIAGLLHDCGRLFLLYSHPQEFRIAAARVREGAGLMAAEREVYGCTHEDVGGLLAKTWGLPDIFVAVCGGHHLVKSGRGPYEKERKIIYLANGIATHVLAGARMPVEERRKSLEKFLEFGLKELSISRKDFKDISSELIQHIEDVAESLEMDLNLGVHKTEDEKKETARQAKSMKDAEKMTRQMAMLHEISSMALDPCVSMDSILQAVTEGIYRGIGFDRVFLIMKAENGRTLTGKMGMGHDAPNLYHQIRVNLAAPEPGLLAAAFDSGKSYNVLDTASPLYNSLPELEIMDILKSDSFAILPISRGDEVIGCVFMDNIVSGQVIGDADLTSVGTLLNLVNMALKNR